MTGSTDPARTRVVYVMGAGRSGSTTLGIVLGNCDGVFFAGELDNWLVRSGSPQVEEPERLEFWRRVRGELRHPDAAEAMFGDVAQRAIERSLSVFRVHLWPARLRLRRSYRAIAQDVYGAVARAAGVDTLVDTSHYPLRALELQRAPAIDLSLVFLVRDPQGVVASFGRRDVQEFNKTTLHTNVYLWVTHLLCVLAFLRQPRERRLFVRYEDLIADPAEVVARILSAAGAPATPPPDFGALQVGFPLQGNRVTRQQTMALRPSIEAVSGGSRLTAVLQAPLSAVLRRLRPAA
jgi:hypothetical protein